MGYSNLQSPTASDSSGLGQHPSAHPEECATSVWPACEQPQQSFPGGEAALPHEQVQWPLHQGQDWRHVCSETVQWG